MFPYICIINVRVGTGLYLFIYTHERHQKKKKRNQYRITFFIQNLFFGMFKAYVLTHNTDFFLFKSTLHNAVSCAFIAWCLKKGKEKRENCEKL